ncbi:hypothetical protein AXF42_Ash013684 [Apostasia shenzhenica]|uniref:Uncharacterized protein n=1 Tax=Apostasia shenzhenica TaxID=1088818 RepID=A0A2I0A4K9_9ASPA|nr:hypothetical protein AXF42_Ash013684 [Apostasia shenzhenica]
MKLKQLIAEILPKKKIATGLKKTQINSLTIFITNYNRYLGATNNTNVTLLKNESQHRMEQLHKDVSEINSPNKWLQKNRTHRQRTELITREQTKEEEGRRRKEKEEEGRRKKEEGRRRNPNEMVRKKKEEEETRRARKKKEEEAQRTKEQNSPPNMQRRRPQKKMEEETLAQLRHRSRHRGRRRRPQRKNEEEILAHKRTKLTIAGEGDGREEDGGRSSRGSHFSEPSSSSSWISIHFLLAMVAADVADGFGSSSVVLPRVSFPPSASFRCLSSRFVEPGRPVPSARRQLAWVSLQGRLVGAAEATSACAVGKGLDPAEAAAWELFTPLHRVLLVALIAISSAESGRSRKISQLQRSVDIRASL